MNEFANELQVKNLENFVNFSLWCAFKKKKRKKKFECGCLFRMRCDISRLYALNLMVNQRFEKRKRDHWSAMVWCRPMILQWSS